MKFFHLLKSEISLEAKIWADEEIITPQQAEKICAKYGAHFPPKNNNLSTHILTILGYLFLGLACITLLGQNWEEIPRALRMFSLIGITAGINFCAWYKYKQNQDSSAVGLFFLGSILYGASIMLIAQIYHIGEHYPDGILWWALGVVPIGVLLKSKAITYLAFGLSTIWLFTEMSLDHFPALLPFFLCFYFFFCIKIKQDNILFLATICKSIFWLQLLLSYSFKAKEAYSVVPENFHILFSLFIGLFALGKYWESSHSHKIKDYGTLLYLWSIRFGIISLLVLSFKDPWSDLLRKDCDFHLVTWAFTLPILAFAFYVSKIYQQHSIAIFAALWLLCCPILLYASDSKDLSVLLQIIDNFTLIGIGIWMIHNGIQNYISTSFYTGLVLILVTAFLRYIDLIGDYLGATLLFIVFALLLLGSAKYWRTKNEN
jgi:uncharacterized membrane protein